MNKKFQYVLVVFALASILLSACAGAASVQSSGGGKVQADSIAYTGVIESINGDQWVVNGQTITVDPAIVRDGPFNVGDTIKVEAQVAQDGSVTITRVEVPSQVDLSQLPQLGDDPSTSANSNDDNGNDDNSNDVNGNDDNSNTGNSNDENSNGDDEVFGIVEAFTSTSVTINGQTYDIQSGGEIKGVIQVGDFVKIHLSQNADGTFSVREMELSDPSLDGNSNSDDDNGNDSNSNDDDDDDNSNGNGNSNDDDDDDDDNSNGNGNSNDDDDDDDNSNDGNSNDDDANGNDNSNLNDNGNTNTNP